MSSMTMDYDKIVYRLYRLASIFINTQEWREQILRWPLLDELRGKTPILQGDRMKKIFKIGAETETNRTSNKNIWAIKPKASFLESISNRSLAK